MCGLGTCDDCLRNVAILKGNPGDNGTNGNSVLSGTGAPDDSLGNDNDFYVDKNAPFNFYFKTAGSWGFLGRLQGTDGNGFFVSESTLISSADLLASGTTPVVITQTPPSGYAIIPVSAVFSLHFNSVAYVAPFGLSIVYNNTSHTLVASCIASFIQASQDTMGVASISTQITYVPQQPLAVMPTFPGTITTGNSELLVRVVYYITPA